MSGEKNFLGIFEELLQRFQLGREVRSSCDVLNNICLFRGVDVIGIIGHSSDRQIEILGELGVNKSFLAQYPRQVLRLLSDLPGEYRSFLRATNGIRKIDTKLSIAGIPMDEHALSLYSPTSLFVLNILEQQAERGRDEICIGSKGDSRRIFMNSGSGAVFLREKSGGADISSYCGIFDFFASED